MKRSARSVAILVVLALATLAASPTWHRDHGTALFDDHATPSRVSDATVAHPNAVDSCPICLSHRLLSQTWVELPSEVERPSAVRFGTIVSGVVPEGRRSPHVSSRAPPAC